MRTLEQFAMLLTPEQTAEVEVELPAGEYVFNRAVTFGAIETFVGTAIIDPDGPNEEILISADVPFEFQFQRRCTFTETTTLLLRLESQDLSQSRYSGVAVEYDTLGG
jgi:hypothetical protein